MIDTDKLRGMGVVFDHDASDKIGNVVYTPLIVSEKDHDTDLTAIAKYLEKHNYKLAVDRLGDSVELRAYRHVYYDSNFYTIYAGFQVVLAAVAVRAAAVYFDPESFRCLATRTWAALSA